ncbi:hypothetical protein [Rhodoferax fermentans]|uniref:hypothetical protein n=1 Tax=Rhodoferax fermentans TaxID=28066 RepID=UPI001301C39C|nr:hypothetical protein [Rhodoferax fermentans]
MNNEKIADRSNLPKQKQSPSLGLDYKDKEADGLKLLASYGYSYDMTISDKDGRTGIDFGVYGVPESLLIHKGGIIRYKKIGPITNEALRDEIIPLIGELQK